MWLDVASYLPESFALPELLAKVNLFLANFWRECFTNTLLIGVLHSVMTLCFVKATFEVEGMNFYTDH